MDWNNDGKNDLLAGDTKGQVWLYLNTGSVTKPVLAAGIRVCSDGKPITGRAIELKDGSGVTIKPQSLMGYYSKLHLADTNGDGLLDLLIGQTCANENHIVVYQNVGTADNPAFGKPTVLALPKNSKSRPSPYMADLDGDGKKDMICGTDNKDILFFKNTGTAKKPKWRKPAKLKLKGPGFEKGYRRRLAVTVCNEDGKTDLLAGDFYSGGGKNGGNIWLFLGK